MAKRLEAYHFAAQATFAAASPSDGSREFEGVAYSGDVITDHPIFEAVVFDLASTKFATPAPALYAHDEEIGVISKAQIGDDVRISGKLLSSASARAKTIADMSDAGMPYQLSVGIWPGSIEDVRPGTSIKLNGRSMKGPLVVYRNNRIRETSFCPLGADARTSVQVFSARAQLSEDNEMDQAEHDRIVAKLNEDHAAALKLATDQGAAAIQRAEKAEGELTTFKADAAKAALERRTGSVKALFSAIGEKYEDAAAKPYLDMTDEQFSAVEAQMKKRRALDPKLMSTQATDASAEGAGTDPMDPLKLADKAREYAAEQAKNGRVVPIDRAVLHVAAAAKAAGAAA